VLDFDEDFFAQPRPQPKEEPAMTMTTAFKTHTHSAPAAAPARPAFSKLALLIPVLGGGSLKSRPAAAAAGVARKPALTKAAAVAEYRRAVAIPRYLEKRQRRKWDKELMHPSRSAAAHRRPRNGGQFGVVHGAFKPASE
jgi:hypothetical protein